MTAGIQFARNLAQKEFLGRGSVIGVGIAGDDGEKLLFLLRDNSSTSKKQILAWAEEVRVKVAFQIASPQPIEI